MPRASAKNSRTNCGILNLAISAACIVDAGLESNWNFPLEGSCEGGGEVKAVNDTLIKIKFSLSHAEKQAIICL